MLAQYLREIIPASDALALAKRKDYPLIHELAGYHDAIDTIESVAEELDAMEQEALGA